MEGRLELFEEAKKLADLYDSGQKDFKTGAREDLKSLMAQVRGNLFYSPV